MRKVKQTQIFFISFDSCWTSCPVFVSVRGIFAQQTHQSCTLHTGLNAGNSDTKQTTNILQYVHFCQCISVIVFIKKCFIFFLFFSFFLLMDLNGFSILYVLCK